MAPAAEHRVSLRITRRAYRSRPYLDRRIVDVLASHTKSDENFNFPPAPCDDANAGGSRGSNAIRPVTSFNSWFYWRDVVDRVVCVSVLCVLMLVNIYGCEFVWNARVRSPESAREMCASFVCVRACDVMRCDVG